MKYLFVQLLILFLFVSGIYFDCMGQEPIGIGLGLAALAATGWADCFRGPSLEEEG